MRIQERPNTILTTCTKMTEEVDRRYVVNGNCSGKGVNDEQTVQNTSPSVGGRLKFFKDGKFILELARAKEGERVGWVSVPRKTFWPPAAGPSPLSSTPPTPGNNTQRGERATSLSVSDDNSSIQSSPWQRDHCWKQSTPRKNISKELAMFYCRPDHLQANNIQAGTKMKRRKPFDPTHLDRNSKVVCNGGTHDRKNGEADGSEDSVDGTVDLAKEREMYHRMKLKKPHQYRKLRVYKKRRRAKLMRKLSDTIDRLREKVAALPTPVNAKLTNCKQDHPMVSPRKRILRDFERFTLEDQASKRRARTAPTLSTASYPPSPGPSQRLPQTVVRPTPVVSKNVSSYSIHNLLSMPDEPRKSPEAKRSPLHYSMPPNKNESPVSSIHSPVASPSPDGLRYRYAPSGSPVRVSMAQRDSPAPATPPYAGSPYSRAYYSPGYRGRESEYMYGGYPPGYLPPMYRAPPSPLCYMHYALAPGTPPGPWAPMQHPLLMDHIPKDDSSSDLPLNLSKH